MTQATSQNKPPIELFDNTIELWPAEAVLVDEFFPKPPAKILDLGCGNGRTTIPLFRRGYRMTGVDLSPEIIATARRHEPRVEFLAGNACALEFPDQSFDAVLFSWNGLDCIPTVTDRRRALREIFRVTKPGGRFIFSSHNALGVWSRLIRPIGLTLIGLRFLRDQCSLQRLRSGWYSAWRDSGAQKETYYYYSAPPEVNRKALMAEGWRVLAVRSDRHPEKTARTFGDVHVQYVCERPEHSHA